MKIKYAYLIIIITIIPTPIINLFNPRVMILLYENSIQKLL